LIRQSTANGHSNCYA